MGFLISAEEVVLRAAAAAMDPPPPPDITRWCSDNIEFDARSPIMGKFNIDRFAFLREIHECLSPEHPSREVTIKGSAQWGKTVSIIQPTLAAWHEYTPLDSLVVHPTTSAAKEWVRRKWLPMRREAPGLRKIFGLGQGEQTDSLMDQETLNRDGSLKVASAGSPSDLTGTTRRLVIMDDVSKFDMTDKGDPEALAASRASGYEDAKILRVSTSLIKGTCRISKAYSRSDRRIYDVPCPHCGNMAPLNWENFKANIQPEKLHAAHFTCEACGVAIDHGDKERIVRLGRWRAQNPRGDHPGFFLWRAYAPQRDWASIAVEYAQVMGWTRIETPIGIGGAANDADTTPGSKDKSSSAVEAETEQTFYNDVLGLEYEQATDAPDWEGLRDRTENAEEGTVLARGILPATGFILTAGVDCQDDRTEVQIVAYGRNRRRWVIEYKIIPYHIGSEGGRKALNAILKAKWRTQLGMAFALDALAIDGGTYTDDVWSWAKTHPWTRVIIVKGSRSANGPYLEPQKFERRNDGQAKRLQKRAFNVNVSQLKGDFYGWLPKADPDQRGYVQFCAGLGDEYYRQITSEVRVLKRSPQGVMTSAWQLVEPTRRNEGLDTMNYSEAAARRKGWTSMTDDEWDMLEAARAGVPAEAQGDLFDAELRVPEVSAVESPPEPAVEANEAPLDTAPARSSWMGPRKKGWMQ